MHVCNIFGRIQGSHVLIIMTGSRINSWALSIAGDVPPPMQISQPSREVHKHPDAHDQVNVSIHHLMVVLDLLYILNGSST